MLQKLSKASILVASLLVASCQTTPLSTEEIAQSQQPKNIILMISDGIGFNGWLAADYYQGLAGKQSYQVTRPDGTTPLVFGLAHSALNLIDREGNLLSRNADISDAAGAIEQGYNPETRWLRFENAMANDFSPVGQSYTSYTDSAAAGTALMSGRKTSVGRINTDWTGTREFETIASIAMKEGRSAGTVSSVMVSHATPAAVVAHKTSRNKYSDIFNEMISTELSVIMGAGHPLYSSSGGLTEGDKDYKYVGGADTFASMQAKTGVNGFTFIDARTDFESLAKGDNVPERVIGIARSGSTLQAARDNLASGDTPSGMAFNTEVPDLATMSKGALNVLKQDKDGFFVMIEGGAIDWMGHANNMPRFIEEQIDFNRAVDSVIEWVEQNSSWQETLLIVTSDHECGGIWGEGTWTNHAGGAVASSRNDADLVAARFNPSEDTFNNYIAVQDRGAGNMPGYQFASRNHTNELVPLWAIGAGAARFNEFVRTDLKAGQLWGEPYNWQGNYVDNTAVFRVMQAALVHSKTN